MKGLSKILSVLLIVSACFGVYKSAEGIKDISSSKDYWEEQGAEANENFDKLDDGIAQLSENEQAYIEGVDQVEQGEADLAKGKADLAKGKADLAKGKADLDKGKADLAKGKADLAAGKKELAKGKTDLATGKKKLDAGKKELADGKKSLAGAEAEYGGEGVPVLKSAYDNVNALMQPKSVDEAAAIAAQSAGVPAEQLQQIYQAVADGMKAGLSEDAAIDKVAAQAAMSQVQTAYEAMKKLVDGYSPEEAAQAVAAKAGKEVSVVKAAYDAVAAGMNAGLSESDAVLEATFAVVASNVDGADAAKVKALYKAKEAYPDDTAAAFAVVAQAVGLPTSIVNNIYHGVQNEIDNGASESEAAARVEASLGGNIPASEIAAVYEGVVNTVAMIGQVYAAVNGNMGSVQAAFENVAALVAKKTPEQAAAIASQNTGNDAAQLQQIYEGVTTGISAGLSKDAALEKVAAQAGRSQVEQAYTGVKELMKGYSKDKAVAAVANAAGKTPEEIKEAYAGYQTYTAGKAKVAAGEKEVAKGEKDYAAGKAKLAAGEKTVAAGEKAVAAGEAKLAAGEKDYAAGKAKLAAGEKTVADGEAKLAEGEAQLAEGKAQLAQYEDGEAQLIDGLNIALGTEAYPGVKAIASRLGKNFDFMKAKGKNVNLAAASDVVKAGRDFIADTEVRVTEELMPKLYGNIAVIIASILALIGGLLGLKGKFKAAGVAGGLSAVAAGVGAAFIKKAGVEMAKIAGSTILGTSLYIGAFVLLAVGAVHAVSNLATKKDA